APRRLQRQLTQAAPALLEPVLAVAERVPLELPQRRAVAPRAGQVALHGGPDRLATLRHHPAAVREARGRAEERTVLPPLDVDHVRRLLAGDDLVLVDPLEVEAQQVAVAEGELEPLPLVLRRARVRDGLAVHHL